MVDNLQLVACPHGGHERPIFPCGTWCVTVI